MQLKDILIIVAIALIGGMAYGVSTREDQSVGSASPFYGNCTVSESLVSVGNATSTAILAKDTTRQWAVLQQPVNATNTVSVSFTGPAITGRGYQIPATSTLDYPKLVFGANAAEVRTTNAVTAISSAGTSTMKLIECKGRDF